MKAESIEIGRVTIPAGMESHFKYVKRDGRVMATPPATGAKYTDSQRKAVDDATKKVRETFVNKAKKLRDAEAAALKALKKDPLNDKLRAALQTAKDERQDFETARKAAEAKAKREARERALK